MWESSLSQLQCMIIHYHAGTALLLVTNATSNSCSQLGIQVKHIDFLQFKFKY
jgi:hypothetical protein